MSPNPATRPAPANPLGPGRLEHDSLGEVRVPREALFGAQTQRALENFDIAPPAVSAFPTLVAALGMVKLAALKANLASGIVPAHLGAAMAAACREMIAGDLDHAFPVPMLQGGAGTSTNMNANEVIANRAGQILGGGLGTYDRVHPNDHVNASQSTNDVYPTAARLAVAASARTLVEALASLALSCRDKGRAFAAAPKLGRTQLQDAVPMTLGLEFDAFASALEGEGRRVSRTAEDMLEVNLGGTAVGTGVNASSAYAHSVIGQLAEISGLPVTRADDLMAASQGSFNYRGRASLSWRKDDLRLRYTVKYLGDTLDSRFRLQQYETLLQTLPNAERPLFLDIDGVFEHDLYAGYDFEVSGTKVRLYGGVNNLFDKTSPFLPTGDAFSGRLTNYNNAYDTAGRRFYVGLAIEF